MNLAVVGAFAETKEEKEAKSAEKVKAQVIKLATGTDARIQVKLKDGTTRIRDIHGPALFSCFRVFRGQKNLYHR